MSYQFDNVKIRKLSLGALQTNCYLIQSDFSPLITLIDPGSETERIIAELGETKIDKVILTHGHYDHIMAVNDLAERYAFDLYVHELEVDLIEDAAKNGSAIYAGVDYIISKTPITVRDGDVIASSGLAFQVVHTPGHTKGSCCFKLALPSENILFTGDTLFKGGYGRTDFYSGDFSSLVNSMRRLLKLPGTHFCFRGHGEETIVGKK